MVLAGSLPRDRALALQREADALLLLAHPTRSQLLNYKLFEYLAAGRPILALAEGTEAGRVATSVGAEVVRADDPRRDRRRASEAGGGTAAAAARRRGCPVRVSGTRNRDGRGNEEGGGSRRRRRYLAPFFVRCGFAVAIAAEMPQ